MEQNKKVFLIVLVGLLGLFGLGFIVLFSLVAFSQIKHLNNLESGKNLGPKIEESLNENNYGPDLLSPISNAPTTEPGSEIESGMTGEEGEEAITMLIKVDWNEKLIEQGNNQAYQEDDYLKEYLAGTISSGEFQGQKLYLESEISLGTTYKHYVLENNQKYYLEENNFNIDGVDNLPETIIFPGTEVILKKGYVVSNLFTDIEIDREVFSHQTLGKVYLSKNYGCLLIELPNHTALSYNMEIPFLNKEEGQEELLNFYFNDGPKNTEVYEYNKIAGCGAMCYVLNVVDQPSDLKAVGKAPSGDAIYALSNKNDSLLTELYNDKNTMAYVGNEGDSQINQYTYQQFIDSNPLLFWKDPLGRWLKFTNRKFVTAAEMCKPAIYLYPEKTINLSVEVAPNGGFTTTIPNYDNGWEVSVQPNGQVTDLKTNQLYDYLYWEGVGMNYPIPDQGWVVTAKDTEHFLDDKLTLLGLNDKEKNDFKDYWLKRFQEENYPYYQISFLDQKQFDELAPLKISDQQPEAIIRVFMTARGLNDPRQISSQELKTPIARTGFTVVEWGGTLLK